MLNIKKLYKTNWIIHYIFGENFKHGKIILDKAVGSQNRNQSRPQGRNEPAF
jgi:hypothetical protein